MGRLDPIAYTYEADYHCPACTRDRFPTSGRFPGWDDTTDTALEDSEGNPVGAVAPWDEWWEPTEDGLQVLSCSDCNGIIDELEAEDGSTWDDYEEDAS